MTRATSKPAIDCVAMKRQAQAKIYTATKGLSVADQIAYFRRRAAAGALGGWWKQVSRLADAPLAVRETPDKKYGK